MVLHARQTGWLCLFIPKGWDQAMRGSFVEPIEPLTSTGTQLYDNQEMSVDALRGFWRAHKTQLKTLPVTNARVFDKYLPGLAVFDEAWGRVTSMAGREKMGFAELRAIVEQESALDESQDEMDADVLQGFDFIKKYEEYKSGAPQTLEDLIRFGVAFHQFSGQVFMDLVEEIKGVEAFPVLIAVDQVNAWEGPSAFQIEKQRIHGRQLCVPHALDFLGCSPTTQGFRKIKAKHVVKRPAAPVSAASSEES